MLLDAWAAQTKPGIGGRGSGRTHQRILDLYKVWGRPGDGEAFRKGNPLRGGLRPGGRLDSPSQDGNIPPLGPSAPTSRPRTDPLKKLVDFLASLKLAVILLVVLLVGLSVGRSSSHAPTRRRQGGSSITRGGSSASRGSSRPTSPVDREPLPVGKEADRLRHDARLAPPDLRRRGADLLRQGGGAARPLGRGERLGRRRPGRAGKGRRAHELPFSVKLEDFVLETYQGTMRPSGFASQVVVTDIDTGKSFPARIWMNTPLHHRGWSLFQSSYQQDGGREATVLSVSKDPGQLVVFAGYATLVLGMILVLLTRVSQKRELEAFEAKVAAGGMSLPTMTRSLLLALALLPLAASARAEGPANVESLKRLPVQHDGRVMPLDTLARETVWNVTGSHSWNGEDPAATFTGWLFDPQVGREGARREGGQQGARRRGRARPRGEARLLRAARRECAAHAARPGGGPGGLAGQASDRGSQGRREARAPPELPLRRPPAPGRPADPRGRATRRPAGTCRWRSPPRRSSPTRTGLDCRGGRPRRRSTGRSSTTGSTRRGSRGSSSSPRSSSRSRRG